jgi:hypothetical protein
MSKMTQEKKILLLRQAVQNMLELEAKRMYEHDMDLDKPEPCPCSGCGQLRAALDATKER